MIWRTGEILDVSEQITWSSRAGFRGVGFHASAGRPGKWQGVDPSAAGVERRHQLRQQLARFEFCEIHAPFAVALSTDVLSEASKELGPVLDLARDVGAAVVTIHAELPTSGTEANYRGWHEAMAGLDAQAAQCGITLGLEVVRGFELIRKLGLLNIGVTLDVGHVYAAEAGTLLAGFGTIGQVVRHIAQDLVHLHVHDYDGVADHIEIGTGRVDFAGLLAALKEIGYDGALCLEANPDRVSPEGIIRSKARLEGMIRRLR
jgi:sugar phosphate isomerase/epimerase